MFTVSITWSHLNPNADTIEHKLARKLGRAPTNHELCEEARRILRDANEVGRARGRH